MRRKPKPTLPDGEHFSPHDLADCLAPALAMPPAQVTAWLARGIDADPPRVRSIRVAGVVRIPRDEAQRLFSGGRKQPGIAPR